ncbi:MoaD/ThiS family protein [Methanobrevibacter millerae]|jgi:sulfur carrier protein|uniref:Thiamine biosynthesis protein ThiS1 n=1 Tax=Methanobrevibacter millerae TaxID=230361 RepID=A0A0U3E2H1_9EURY|nr:MoaD/ThiS family protein [Methanobrevibacter millerae]ALT68215.1 thiamine biosynthesis protein ThiS1 [Methanobrevibacter millerae]MBO6109447.1 MoaD/ThiS family protein [Methanobrevibacter sp.]MBP3226060.1 MoaD/ThiS family protein [Methanobrevibacter sp.]
MSFTLKIQENLESREITSQNYTIKDLILELGLSAQTVVAKQNGELVIEDTLINDGDEIQLIQIIYGG